jgi:hypothetical protein
MAAGASLLLALVSISALLYQPIQQLRAVNRLESLGVRIAFATELDEHAQEVKTWSWFEEAVLPRNAYVRVQRLDFRGTHTRPVDVAASLLALRDLNQINLAGTRTNDEDIALLSQIPSIRHLVLRATEVTDQSINNLVKMRQLTVVDLNETAISNQGIVRLHDQLPDCIARDLTNSWPREIAGAESGHASMSNDEMQMSKE